MNSPVPPLFAAVTPSPPSHLTLSVTEPRCMPGRVRYQISACARPGVIGYTAVTELLQHATRDRKYRFRTPLTTLGLLPPFSLSSPSFSFFLFLIITTHTSHSSPPPSPYPRSSPPRLFIFVPSRHSWRGLTLLRTLHHRHAHLHTTSHASPPPYPSPHHLALFTTAIPISTYLALFRPSRHIFLHNPYLLTWRMLAKTFGLCPWASFKHPYILLTYTYLMIQRRTTKLIPGFSYIGYDDILKKHCDLTTRDAQILRGSRIPF